MDTQLLKAGDVYFFYSVYDIYICPFILNLWHIVHIIFLLMA